MSRAKPNLFSSHLRLLPFVFLSIFWSLIIGNVHAYDEPQKAQSDDDLNPFFVAQLRHAAKQHKQFGRVDETRMQWSPLLCRRPDPKNIHAGKGVVSESEDAETHGGKIYFLFVKDRSKYQNRAKQQPFGQILVKESWTYKPAPSGFSPDAKRHRKFDDDASLPIGEVRGGYLPYAEKDGKWFKADQLKALFVMIKLSSETPETDGGWIYGTVSKDGKVSSAGRVDSCIQCHQTQPNDRMFFHPDFRTRPAPESDLTPIRSQPKSTASKTKTQK